LFGGKVRCADGWDVRFPSIDSHLTLITYSEKNPKATVEADCGAGIMMILKNTFKILENESTVSESDRKEIFNRMVESTEFAGWIVEYSSKPSPN
jgi:hypothetical protein